MDYDQMLADYTRNLSEPRGVVKTTHPGFSVVYVPDAEEGRVTQALEAAGIQTVATGLYPAVGDVSTFTALVHSDDTMKLDAIVNGTGAP
jgi:hypothetical protein